MCHCKNCKSAFAVRVRAACVRAHLFTLAFADPMRAEFTGGPYGITTRIPLDTFKVTQGTPTHHKADNGSGTLLHRLFCPTCGGAIAEWGDPVDDKLRYVFTGAFDDMEQEGLKPQGEFFTSRRASWLVPVEGTFQKREIKE